MIPQTITLPHPVTLDLRQTPGPRPRVVNPESTSPQPDDPAHEPVWQEFTEFPAWVTVDANAREIRAQLPPMPQMLPLYGPADFAAAAADTMEDHAARVLHLLGKDPASVLQALCDGTELPPLPPRVPREIPNWRAKVILAQMGLLASVEAAIAALPEPDHTVVSLAWGGDAKLARRGKTVLGLAAALGLSPDQIDQLFIAAEALEV
jgi:hypothetical protein